MQTIGERIKFIRKEKHITQKDVKATIGIGQSTLSDIENGKNTPSYDTILSLSKFFEVSPEWLLTGKEAVQHKSVDYSFTPEELHLIELYRQLSPINKTKITERVETMIDFINETEVIYKAVPLVGHSAAGTPIETLEQADYEEIETDKIKSDFALTIKGQSMEPMINDGSIIFVHQTAQLENGEIGVFQINDTSFSTDEEVTCKIYKYLAPNHIQLLSINPDFAPIDINPAEQDFRILGKVIL